MTLFLRARAGRILLCAAMLGLAPPACYTSGNGTPPPMNSFYFPTGLAVSSGGNVLYAINSDFDLQWNGGTLQSYDLYRIRRDAAGLVQANLNDAPSPPPALPLLEPWTPHCLTTPPQETSLGLELLHGCSPAVDSSQYVTDSAIVGAFATDLQLSHDRIGGSQLLFAPMSGNATVLWTKVAADDLHTPPPQGAGASYAPFTLDCPPSAERVDSRCDSSHFVGNDSNSPHNTRNLTMPGEPFGMAQSEDGSVLAVTSESDTKTSLLTTGFGQLNSEIADYPTMQFVLDGLPQGGVAITAIPHDPYAVTRCEDVGDQANCIRQAFLQTSRYTNEVDVLRYWDDDGSSLHRPFLTKDAAVNVDTNLGGIDFRGIAIDTTERIACEANPASAPASVCRLTPLQMCGTIPARVFIASRSSSSLVLGKLGQFEADCHYNPDALTFTGAIPLPPGPSKVYLGPVILPDAQGVGRMYLRVFVMLYDSSAVAVIDPSVYPPKREAIIPVGPGPYSLAFDPFCFSARCKTPFSLDDVATNETVPADTRQAAGLGLRQFRFGYVGIFRHSYVQAIDLDDVATKGKTFEFVVYNLGAPQIPKGQSQ